MRMRAKVKKPDPPTNKEAEDQAEDNPAPKALNALAGYLAARDHSRHELKTKLSRRFSESVIEQVLSEAEARNWLPAPEEIARRAALAWQRRHKSRRYIEGQLRKRQLPLPPRDAENENIERQNVRLLVEKKFGPPQELTFEERVHAQRFLRFRGFDDHTIRTVLHAES